MIKKIIFVFCFFFFINETIAEDNLMILKLKDGDVVIELYNEIAPKHVERFKTLAKEGKYDGVVFHRVIDGFMAQTGDVQYGNSNSESYNLRKAGTGSSEYPDLKSEFSDLPHERGTLSMARSNRRGRTVVYRRVGGLESNVLTQRSCYTPLATSKFTKSTQRDE